MVLEREKLAILRRTERPIWGVKMMNRKNSDKLMDTLILYETMNKMAKTNKAKWYGSVLRRKDGDVLLKALEFKLDGQKIGRPKMTWRTQME